MRPIMPQAETVGDNDGWTIFQNGRKRLVSKQTLTGSLEARMKAIEDAPNNSALAQRVGGLEQWRQSKADAIAKVNTSMGGMRLTIAGIGVSGSGLTNEVERQAFTINKILDVMVEREIISA